MDRCPTCDSALSDPLSGWCWNMPRCSDEWHAGRVDLPEGVKHGDLAGYIKHGCRCTPCRGANARSSRAYRRSPKGREKDQQVSRLHSKARTILKERHYDEYRNILAELREEASRG